MTRYDGIVRGGLVVTEAGVAKADIAIDGDAIAAVGPDIEGGARQEFDACGLHVFPGDDVGARNNLLRWLGLEGPLDYDGVRRVLSPWSPYGGLIYFHLLLDRLAEARYIG